MFARLSQPRIGLVLAAASVVALAGARASHAQTYNLATDFNFANANALPWTYGCATSLSAVAASLSVMDTQVGSVGNLRGWSSTSAGFVDGTPNIIRNDSAAVAGFTQPGQVSMHPSPDGTGGAVVVVRFTAPLTGVYNLNSQYFSGDPTGETNITVFRNAASATPLFSSVTSTNPVFNTTLNLTAGDRLNFVVDTAGDYRFEQTPVNINLAFAGSAAAPEPGSLALLALPALGLLAARRRRR